MTFKNRKYFNLITIQSVDDAITSVNKFSNVGITYFWHSPSASRVVSQQCFCMVNNGIYKPDSALRAIACDELLYLSQIFTSFP